ncbi:hypothetical protein L210DRAFT_3506160 [Boletus edulis BED1]|uniref:Uncharacterized protein n=1 Tax=Boletus edulis BED1 TaxID=1328754 RepID=A0AAD4GC83_BOLED|nr:hypothetical protein L210DRAFT_3506160 [Boletus edulis BED1]
MPTDHHASCHVHGNETFTFTNSIKIVGEALSREARTFAVQSSVLRLMVWVECGVLDSDLIVNICRQGETTSGWRDDGVPVCQLSLAIGLCAESAAVPLPPPTFNPKRVARRVYPAKLRRVAPKGAEAFRSWGEDDPARVLQFRVKLFGNVWFQETQAKAVVPEMENTRTQTILISNVFDDAFSHFLAVIKTNAETDSTDHLGLQERYDRAAWLFKISLWTERTGYRDSTWESVKHRYKGIHERGRREEHHRDIDDGMFSSASDHFFLAHCHADWVTRDISSRRYTSHFTTASYCATMKYREGVEYVWPRKAGSSLQVMMVSHLGVIVSRSLEIHIHSLLAAHGRRTTESTHYLRDKGSPAYLVRSPDLDKIRNAKGCPRRN